jgi:hypothetical protein
VKEEPTTNHHNSTATTTTTLARKKKRMMTNRNNDDNNNNNDTKTESSYDDDDEGTTKGLGSSPPRPRPSPAMKQEPKSKQEQQEQDQEGRGKASGTATATAEDELMSLQNPARLPFPLKLHAILDEAEANNLTHIVSWTHNGEGFKVHNKHAFEAKFIPRYFTTTTYRGYHRNLNLWGFKTVNRGGDRGTCWHPHFKRGRKDLCRHMERVAVAAAAAAAAAAASSSSSKLSSSGVLADVVVASRPTGSSGAAGPVVARQEISSSLQALLAAGSQQQQHPQPHFVGLPSSIDPSILKLLIGGTNANINTNTGIVPPVPAPISEQDQVRKLLMAFQDDLNKKSSVETEPMRQQQHQQQQQQHLLQLQQLQNAQVFHPTNSLWNQTLDRNEPSVEQQTKNNQSQNNQNRQQSLVRTVSSR